MAQMFNPAHPGRVLKNTVLRKDGGISVTEFAKHLKVSRVALSIQVLFMIVVKPDKVTKGDREFDVLGNIKRVEAESVFQSRNDQRETQ